MSKLDPNLLYGLPHKYDDPWNSNRNSGENATDVPVIQSWNEMKLVDGAHWDPDDKTTIVMQKGGKSNLIVGSILLVVFVGIAIIAKDPMVLIYTLPFTIAAICFIVSGIHHWFDKTWIQIGSDTLSIQHGLSRNYNSPIIFSRSSKTKIDVIDTKGEVMGKRLYDVKIKNEAKSVMIAPNISQLEAQKVKRMFDLILNAKLPEDNHHSASSIDFAADKPDINDEFIQMS